ncbi:aminopeptidase P [Alkalibaculum bacchi]|jgi:Xaa-Pro aminopeptidase|uniref:Xaa-Pro aminopeptidase n=1 Tax=Alkalibaculum bacchi TaxID=645887 RepID=A0A366I3R2_9FIRM|nr:aminopeptidase P family protein [Alkalibaculum bacchi]RBP62591.1 aminopeptidase P [Alkalibaculum bacchi]
MLTKNFFTQNRRELYENLQDNSMAIFFSGKAPHKSNDAYYMFEVDRNFYYLTGIAREDIILVAIKYGDVVEEYLFIEKFDPILAKWVGAKISADEAKSISGIENIMYVENIKSKLVQILGSGAYNVENVYFDYSRYAWDYSDKMSSAFSTELLSKYPYLIKKNASKILTKLRTIKKPEEVKCMKKAIDITKEGIESMMIHAKPGMAECEFEAHFDFVLKCKGAGHAFDTIAASGINGTILHYVANNKITEDNDLILFDLGASADNYCADITRTFPVNGTFTERQKDVYNVVLHCNKEIIRHMKPGVSTVNLNKLAKDLLAQGCKELDLIDNLEDVSKYYYHSIGHPLGLDTHDVGDRNIILQPGMVYTCEPGLYVEEEAIGIRIEDDILITEDGNINLSEHIIKEIDDIEAFMNK